MNYIEEHKVDSKDVKGGWIMVFLAGFGLVILSL
jgi:hypothetical protein